MSDEPSVLELTARSERGDPEAQYLLGKRYYGGEGVESDLQKAVILISSAADAGFPDAQYTYGYFKCMGSE